MRFTTYDTEEFFDEMFEGPAAPRAAARALTPFINTLPEGELLPRQRSAERALLNMGITFNVYGDSAGTERIFRSTRSPASPPPPSGTPSSAA